MAEVLDLAARSLRVGAGQSIQSDDLIGRGVKSLDMIGRGVGSDDVDGGGSGCSVDVDAAASVDSQDISFTDISIADAQWDDATSALDRSARYQVTLDTLDPVTKTLNYKVLNPDPQTPNPKP